MQNFLKIPALPGTTRAPRPVATLLRSFILAARFACQAIAVGLALISLGLCTRVVFLLLHLGWRSL